MTTEELRGLPPADLRSRIAQLEEERFRLQFRSATEALEEPLRLRALRKDIARVHTILNEKLKTANAKPQTRPQGAGGKAK
jgi:large subunit ribosomal protein L29